MQDLKRVAILGCTGSIGTQALDVCRQHADKLSVVALSAHSRTSDLAMFAREFGVARVAVTDPDHFDDASLCDLPDACSLYKGSQAAIDICMHEDVDIVLVSIVGAAGLSATYQLIAAGKQVALANKESLVVGGDLIMPMVKPGQMLPVDSEHAAIFQCYQGENPRETHCIWLTCSGGPFFGRTRDQLASVTPADALAHPTWNMGAKITIDSATLMNKGLELIEAVWLFGLPPEKIQIVVQRQSIVHSAVQYSDNSIIAQLGVPDMRIPIGLAMTYPNRLHNPAPALDLLSCGPLTFDPIDEAAFPCFALAKEAAKTGGTACTAMNAANEEAVALYLQDRIGFYDIPDAVAAALRLPVTAEPSLDDIFEADRLARAYTRERFSDR